MKKDNSEKQSKCVYCDSTSYGTGCVFSPNKIHCHMTDPKRCIYCGSLAYGTGCVYSPLGKIHVHGVMYNNTIKEAILNSSITGMFLDKLLNEKTPKQNNITDVYINRIKHYIGEKIVFLKMEPVLDYLKDSVITTPINKTLLEEEVNTQHKIQDAIDLLKRAVNDGVQCGLDIKTIESQIINAILL